MLGSTRNQNSKEFLGELHASAVQRRG